MRSHALITAGWVAGMAMAALAQTTQPAAGVSTQPADGQAMEARVIQVSGRVEAATVGADGTTGQWQPVKLNDQLAAGTKIRTQLRSRLVLAFGDDTVVMIDRATLASIDQFRREGDTKKVRLGLGHGAVRAGVAETTLRSDMTIETPTATLSKRGTMDFGIEYEPSAGRFRIFLLQQGLVEAINKIMNESRWLRPGEYITQAMLMWINQAKIDRHVIMQDPFGLTGSERVFHIFHVESGIVVMEPGGGSTGFNAPVYNRGLQVGGVGLPGGVSPAILQIIPRDGVFNRSEGNFGTGGGLGR